MPPMWTGFGSESYTHLDAFPDGSFVMSSLGSSSWNNNDEMVYYMMFDCNGVFIDGDSMSPFMPTEALGLRALRDSGFTIQGHFPPVSGAQDSAVGFVTRFDPSGIQLVQTNFGNGLNGGYRISDVYETHDTALVVTGTYTPSPNVEHVFISKINFAGDTLWTNRFQHGGVNTQGRMIRPLRSGGYMVYAQSTNSILARLDATGDTVWTRLFDPDELSFVGDMLETADGQMMLTGRTDTASAPCTGGLVLRRSTFLKVDLNGNLTTVWNLDRCTLTPVFSFFSATSYGGMDLRYDADSTIIAVGMYEKERSPGTNPFDPDVVSLHGFFARFDSAGTYLASGMTPYDYTVTGYYHDFVALSGGRAGLLGYSTPTIDPELNFFSMSMSSSSSSTQHNLTGNFRLDTDSNCVADTNLINLTAMVRLLPSNAVALSSPPSGYFSMLAPMDSSILEIAALPPYWEETCPDPVHVDLINNSSQNAEFTVRPIVNGPLLRVDVASLIVRNCVPGTYTVHYANEGTAPAYNARVTLELDDRLSMQNATLPWLQPQSGQVYEFQLDTVPAGFTGQFRFFADPDCIHPLGAKLSIQSHITPDSFYLPAAPIWDGSDLEVDASCNATADSVIFTVRNVGSNAMATSGQVLVLEDNLMRQTFPVQLNAGQDTTWTLRSTGQTWYLFIDQQPGHPLSNFAADELEGCGTDIQGNYTIGYAGRFPLSDYDYFRSHDCFP
ncbi:MAG: hypothetical protein AAF570_02880, partial [Bacteroidota bacterium]